MPSERVETRILPDDPAATEALGERLGLRLEPGQHVALLGEMGAGKTCLTRGIARGLGVLDPDAVTSPTYLLVVEHPGKRATLVHVDAYLPDKTEGFLLDGGLDYLAELPDAVVVVEWADRLQGLLPPADLTVRLGPDPGGGRAVTIEARGDKMPWLRAL